PDAGPPRDASVTAPDAGTRPDASSTPRDAFAADDTSALGPDAGAVRLGTHCGCRAQTRNDAPLRAALAALALGLVGRRRWRRVRRPEV
ncbi:MAG: hypothetical protein J0L92_14305, partial [Deltaproteobacteria bacterium]|nr:hypothetical protein [Deltaproteobacteria bacterium]